MNPQAWGRGVTARVATRDVPDEVKRLVDARQGGRFCEECRALGIEQPGDGPALELDHRKPLAKGGDHHHSNLRWSCRSHNRGRGARAPGAARMPKWAREKR